MKLKLPFKAKRNLSSSRFICILVLVFILAGYGISQTPAAIDKKSPDVALKQGKDHRSQENAPAQPSQGAPLDPGAAHLPLRIVPMLDDRLPTAHEAGLLSPPGAHMTYFGGQVISNVHIVQVLYGTGNYLSNVSSTASPSVASFFTDATQSPYFDMLSEYSTAGVVPSDGGASSNQVIGHGFFDGQFAINPSAANNGGTLTDNQIQAELLSQVNAGNLPAPVLDAQGNNETLYMIYFPQGKTITLGGISSCQQQGFCAYHNSTTTLFASKPLFYGVLPDMQAPSLCATGCASTDPFQNVTIVSSHEMAEAVTDADVGPATVPGRPLAWTDAVSGAEIGDVCQGQNTIINVSAQTYVLQQEFSNLQNGCAGGPVTYFFQAPFSIVPGTKFDVTVNASSGSNVTSPLTNYRGTIHFTSSDPAATIPADYTYTFADAGSHTFIVEFNTTGNQTLTVNDTQLPFTGTLNKQVQQPTATLLFVTVPQTAGTGTSVPVLITVADSSFNLDTSYKGTLHFTSNDPSAVLPADSQLANGTGTFSVVFNTTGSSDSLVITDVANSNLQAQRTVDVFAAGATPTSTTLTASPNPSTFGQPVTYTATVTGGVPPLTGGVSFSPLLVGAPLDASGHASVTVTLPGGTNPVFAEYSATSLLALNSNSAPINGVVNPAPTNINVTSSEPASSFSDDVTFTATISSPVALTTTGNQGFVMFNDGAVPIAIIPTGFLGNGLVAPATFSTPALSVGQHSITASFSGTPSFAASTSSAAVQTVSAPGAADYSLTIASTSATVAAGQTANFSFTAKSLNGFTGTLQFSCGTLPLLTTCTFSPADEFMVTAGTTFTTLNVQTTGPHASLLIPGKPVRRYGTGWESAAFLLGMVLLAGTSQRVRRRSAALLLLATMIVAALTSCGGGGSSAALPPPPPPTPTPVSATPAGTSLIVVTATATSASGPTTTTTKQLNLSLTVTQ